MGERPGVEHAELRAVAHQPVGQCPQPAEQQGGVHIRTPYAGFLLDQVRRPAEALGSKGMLDRRGQAPVFFLIPAPGAAVQFGDLARVYALKTFAQEGSEKVMITVIASSFVQRYQEEVGLLQSFEHLSSTGRAR